MDEPRKTQRLAYEVYLAHIAAGEIPACIPIDFEGEPGVWTIAGIMPTGSLRTTYDGVAAAMVAIQKARHEAIKAGLHPLN